MVDQSAIAFANRALKNSGVKVDKGDKVTIVGFPAKSGSKVMLLEKVILADGKELVPALLD